MFNKIKASTIANLVIWVGVLGSVSLIVFYGLPKIQPTQVNLDHVYQDANSLQSILNKACVTTELDVEFNPILNKGNLIFNKTNFCINSSSFKICKEIQCEFSNLDDTFEIGDITLLIVNKKSNSIEVEVI